MGAALLGAASLLVCCAARTFLIGLRWFGKGKSPEEQLKGRK